MPYSLFSNRSRSSGPLYLLRPMTKPLRQQPRGKEIQKYCSRQHGEKYYHANWDLFACSKHSSPSQVTRSPPGTPRLEYLACNWQIGLPHPMKVGTFDLNLTTPWHVETAAYWQPSMPHPRPWMLWTSRDLRPQQFPLWHLNYQGHWLSSWWKTGVYH